MKREKELKEALKTTLQKCGYVLLEDDGYCIRRSGDSNTFYVVFTTIERYLEGPVTQHSEEHGDNPTLAAA